MKRGLWIGKFVVLGVLFVVVFGLVTQFLWNLLVPELFSGPVISFWQALGLLTLSKLLFSGFGGGHKGGKWGSYRSQHWRSHLKEKYSSLTPEQREKFRERFNEKWCSWDENPSTKEAATNAEVKNS